MKEFELLLAAANRGEVVQTATLIAAPPAEASAVGRLLLLYADGRTEGELVDADFTAAVAAGMKYGEWPGPCTRTILYRQAEYRLFWNALGHDRFKAVILGGGHISQPLAELLAILDFEVTVADDRPDFANRQRFPRAAEVVCDDFGAFLAGLKADANTAIIIITRGHQHDLECLRRVATLPAGYAGMIGSRRKVQAVLAALEAEGLEERLLARVRAPIGLDIGAQGPAEIALSIAAEVVAVFRGGGGLPLSGRGNGNG